ncbi:MAG: hypothetical protein H6745_15635 [Deltaproteobacteria bacterium]|nr:hypothetical protein [Deltaproteobacteria bacterium]
MAERRYEPTDEAGGRRGVGIGAAVVVGLIAFGIAVGAVIAWGLAPDAEAPPPSVHLETAPGGASRRC